MCVSIISSVVGNRRIAESASRRPLPCPGRGCGLLVRMRLQRHRIQNILIVGLEVGAPRQVPQFANVAGPVVLQQAQSSVV